MNKPVKNRTLPYLFCLGFVSATTFLGELVKTRLEPTNVVMFYLLAVVIAAIRWGQGPAAVTSICSVLAFDFFLVPPYLTLNVHDIEYLFTFAAFLAVGLIVSTLTSKVREQIIQRQTEKLYSALLNSISHDLKTPLASITGSLSALLQENSNFDSEQIKELLRTAGNEADRLNRLVNNLLDMARTESGVLKIFKTPCDLHDFIGACFEQLKDKIVDRNVRISVPKQMPEVSLDFPYMLKAFVNIIDNALKYSSAGSPIDVEAYVLDATVRINVRDYGYGILKEDLERIFDKFYRAVTNGNAPGTGLGLSIAKNIIEAHGGTISAQSTSSEGSVFMVELPLQ